MRNGPYARRHDHVDQVRQIPGAIAQRGRSRAVSRAPRRTGRACLRCGWPWARQRPCDCRDRDPTAQHNCSANRGRGSPSGAGPRWKRRRSYASHLPVRWRVDEAPRGVVGKFGFNLRFPPKISRVQKFCTERGLSFRISQFKCRALTQSLSAPKQSGSFVRLADALLATGRYRIAV
jgi:hypothetical protein